MVALNYFGFRRGHVGLKKSVTLIPDVKHFFRHVTSNVSGRAALFGPATAGQFVDWVLPSLSDSFHFYGTATGSPVDLTVDTFLSHPVAVFMFAFSMFRGSRKSFQLSSLGSVVLSGCRPF